MDPAVTYYQFDYIVLLSPAQRALYGWKADETKPVPDLADGHAGGQRRRQDGHGQDPARASSSARR